MEIIGPKLVKREFVQPKFRRKTAQATAPVTAPAAGGYASAGLIEYVVIAKYQHYRSLYRIEAMSAQWGAELSRKTMVDWVRIAADWAEPIYTLMPADLPRGHYVQCDENR